MIVCGVPLLIQADHGRNLAFFYVSGETIFHIHPYI